MNSPIALDKMKVSIPNATIGDFFFFFFASPGTLDGKGTGLARRGSMVGLE